MSRKLVIVYMFHVLNYQFVVGDYIHEKGIIH
jgi:Cu2+-containing amine oxidase